MSEAARSFAATAERAVARALGAAPWPADLVVHVVGGQPQVEGADAMFAPLAAAAAARGCASVTVAVVGPEMARDRAANGGGAAARVAHYRAYYDEWAPSQPPPAVILLFHPGFWGYATWRPTLRHLLAGDAPVVATAYTPQEAELDAAAIGAAALDDADAGDAAADAAAEALPWLWRPAVNEARSAAPRPTASAPPGHDYRENHAWYALAPGAAAARGRFRTPA